MRFSGARPGELRAWQWEHVQADTVTLEKHKTARQQRRPRVIMLHPVVGRLLAWVKERAPRGTTFVFLNSRGEPWTKSAVDLRLYRLKKRLGLAQDCKLYGCRHAFGTRAALAAVPGLPKAVRGVQLPYPAVPEFVRRSLDRTSIAAEQTVVKSLLAFGWNVG